MSEPFVGEIRLVGFNFAPQGWQFCDGSLISISQNEVLFVLLGTTYGGDGQTTFALPDLRGRAAISQGNNGDGHSYVMGQVGGQESVLLTTGQIPSHVHSIQVSTASGQTPGPSGQTFAANTQIEPYELSSGSTSGVMLGPDGGGTTHENRMPYLAMNYIISLFGIFPSQN
jgi:microcystin-dependent protein